MRMLAIPFLLTLLPSQRGPSSSQTPPIQRPCERGKDFKSELLMTLQDIQKKLEQAGFKEVVVIPEAVLVRAKKDDKSVMMIIDPVTMTAIQLTGPSPSETTGSGSSDDEAIGVDSQREVPCWPRAETFSFVGYEHFEPRGIGPCGQYLRRPP